jgi:hypothetical protein
MVQTVYLLWHQFEFRNSNEEDLADRAKWIGVYTDEEEARRAAERVKDQPGFRDHLDGIPAIERIADESPFPGPMRNQRGGGHEGAGALERRHGRL